MFDIGCNLGRQFDRARRPAQGHAPLRSAKIVKEPGATGKRGMGRAFHLEQPHQPNLRVVIAHLVFQEEVLARGRHRIDKSTAESRKALQGSADKLAREPIVDGVGMVFDELHRFPKRPAPFLTRMRIETASAIRPPAFDTMPATP